MSVFLIVLLVFALLVVAKTIKIVPQKQVMIIERLGKYHKTAEAGLNIIVPFLIVFAPQSMFESKLVQLNPNPLFPEIM